VGKVLPDSRTYQNIDRKVLTLKYDHRNRLVVISQVNNQGAE
jgi:hypothetical protein